MRVEMAMHREHGRPIPSARRHVRHDIVHWSRRDARQVGRLAAEAAAQSMKARVDNAVACAVARGRFTRFTVVGSEMPTVRAWCSHISPVGLHLQLWWGD